MNVTGPAEVSRLGVIGDVHAEDHRLAAAIKDLQQRGVDAIVCTGDIVDGEGCPDRCIELLIDANVHTVRGNHDRWILEDKARHVPNAHFLADRGDHSQSYLSTLPTQICVPTIRGNLMLCHGIEDDDLRKIWPGTEKMGIERSKRLDRLIHDDTYRFVINGHMHFRTLIHFQQLTLINAGTLKGELWPGYSLIDFHSGHIDAFGFDGTDITPIKSRMLDQDSDVVWKDTQDFSGGWDPVRLF